MCGRTASSGATNTGSAPPSVAVISTQCSSMEGWCHKAVDHTARQLQEAPAQAVTRQAAGGAALREAYHARAQQRQAQARYVSGDSDTHQQQLCGSKGLHVVLEEEGAPGTLHTEGRAMLLDAARQVDRPSLPVCAPCCLDRHSRGQLPATQIFVLAPPCTSSCCTEESRPRRTEASRSGGRPAVAPVPQSR